LLEQNNPDAPYRRVAAQPGARDIIVFGGGVVPDEAFVALSEAGIERIFMPGAAIADIVAWLEERVGSMK
jgi:methylmalonyl-CoA mutase cobalamin-binding domain/chain